MSNKCLHFVKQLLSLFSLLSKVQCNTKIDLENLKPLFFVCICQNMFIYSYRLKENVLYFEACPADLFGSNYSVLCLLLFFITFVDECQEWLDSQEQTPLNNEAGTTHIVAVHNTFH